MFDMCSCIDSDGRVVVRDFALSLGSPWLETSMGKPDSVVLAYQGYLWGNRHQLAFLSDKERSCQWVFAVGKDGISGITNKCLRLSKSDMWKGLWWDCVMWFPLWFHLSTFLSPKNNLTSTVNAGNEMLSRDCLATQGHWFKDIMQSAKKHNTHHFLGTSRHLFLFHCRQY